MSQKSTLLPLLVGIVLGLIGCQESLDIRNAAPAVATLGPIVEQDEDTLLIYLTIQDIERDPVDIAIDVVDAEGTTLPFDGDVGTGHGSIGLSSDTTFPGTPHVISWDVRELEPGDYALRLTPDDRIGGVGRTVVSPTFSLSEGLVELTIPQ